MSQDFILVRSDYQKYVIERHNIDPVITDPPQPDPVSDETIEEFLAKRKGGRGKKYPVAYMRDLILSAVTDEWLIMKQVYERIPTPKPGYGTLAEHFHYLAEKQLIERRIVTERKKLFKRIEVQPSASESQTQS